ncbi:MAG: hypothetical protein DWQ09_11760 [Proteobacteria bacterium]|nr:MAG: hypothetical protein DWQ09_11760 [Pseudomonadota bacterium]
MPTEPINSLSANESVETSVSEALEATSGQRYDHAKKAGNQGDLVKHAALLAAVSYIAYRQHCETFVYAESHAGPACHTLQPGGAWEAGIGAFGRRVAGVDEADRRWPALHPYTATAFRHTPCAGSTYQGSHVLVHRMLTRADVTPRMHLWDISSHVCADLRLRYRSEPGAHISRSDGYSGLAMLPYVDLALVDAPAFEPRRIAQTIAGLSIKETPFLCWIPRIGVDSGEDPVVREFRDLVAEDYFVGTAQWQDWTPGLCGCAVVASPELQEPLSAVMTELLWAMGWRP